MDTVLGFLQAHRAWSIAAGAGVVGLVAIGGTALAGGDRTHTVAVTGIVAGDVINVEADGKEWVVSLLNLDTPQDCLTGEAAAYLESVIPAGTRVELENGREKYDEQGRELAGVFLDGTLVNAEVARAGLGAAVVDGTDDTFYDEVQQAQKEAEEAGKGLYSADTACTVPGQVQAYLAAAAQVESKRSAALSSEDLAEIDGYAAEAAAAALLGSALHDVLDGARSALPLASFGDAQVWNMRGDVGGADDTVKDVTAVIATRREGRGRKARPGRGRAPSGRGRRGRGAATRSRRSCPPSGCFGQFLRLDQHQRVKRWQRLLRQLLCCEGCRRGTAIRRRARLPHRAGPGPGRSRLRVAGSATSARHKRPKS